MFKFEAALAMTAATAFAAGGGSSWHYTQNGADWGSIDEYSLCGTGKQQSPIDLTQDGAKSSDSMELNGSGYKNYANAGVYWTGGKTMQVSIADDGNQGQFTIDFWDGSSSTFVPLQFHLHGPSEHSVNGKLYDLEVHIVHKYKQAGEMKLGAVIGVFFEVQDGASNNAFLDSLMVDRLDTSANTGPSSAMNVNNLNLEDFLKSVDFRSYWNYNGSLTTPPCTEGIEWTVIETPIPISRSQFEHYEKLWAGDANYANGKGNNRVVNSISDHNLYFQSGAAALVAGSFAAVAAIMF